MRIDDEQLEDKRRILALQDAVLACGASYKKLKAKSRKERDDYRAMIALLKAEVKKLQERLIVHREAEADRARKAEAALDDAYQRGLVDGARLRRRSHD